MRRKEEQEQNQKKHRSSKSQDLNNLVQLLVLSTIVGILKHVSQNLIIWGQVCGRFTLLESVFSLLYVASCELYNTGQIHNQQMNNVNNEDARSIEQK